MRKRSVMLSVMVSILAILSVTCDNRNRNDTTTSLACSPTEEQPALPSSASGALIVTDISGSMRGFALPHSTRLYTLHDTLERAVRNAVAVGAGEASPTIRRCYLGERLDCQAQTPLQALDRPTTYSARESRLDLFFTPAQQGASGNAESKSQEDPINPYRIAILVTDGMQARSPGASAGSPCLGGADPECIAYLLKQRAQQGYGIWMALLLLPFQGTHFAERPLDNSHWQRIQQHVTSLAQDPYFQGVSFRVQRSGQAVPFTSYQFQGVKPLLVLALSRDKQVGRRFIQQFTSSVSGEGIVQPVGGAYWMELAPLSIRPRKVSKISLASSGQIRGVRPVVGKRQDKFYDYLIECDRDGLATLIVNWEEQEGIQMVPDGVQVNFGLEPSGGSLPQGRLTITKALEKSFEARLSCRQVREGKYEAWFKLQAHFKVDPNVTSFWAALHAENMYEAPERLYGLRDVVQNVLEAVIRQPRITDCVRFRIERK